MTKLTPSEAARLITKLSGQSMSRESLLRYIELGNWLYPVSYKRKVTKIPLLDELDVRLFATHYVKRARGRPQKRDDV